MSAAKSPPRRTVPRVAAIHDISCFGKCSLTVALPILSAAGIECSVIPTAVLSTHTGGFTGYTYRDLTEDIMPIFEHWRGLGLTFDAGYSGFLGSRGQLEIVSEIFREMKKDGALIVVDPVMADDGRLYSTFGADFPDGMRRLCAGADVIVPNITEAALMTGMEYRNGPYTKEYIEEMLSRLGEITPGLTVLTGVFFDEARLGAACLDVKTGEIGCALAERVPGSYHGTGDVFASVLTAGLTLKMTPLAAMRAAAEFTSAAAKRTKDAGSDTRFGVNFEAGLALGVFGSAPGRLTPRLSRLTP
ncbi:MAG: pyridoxamine kinase [Oscillospiraceae bacterium]|jgi:pyridoxine kinase|nr:pyridoxamine kinase [Oscillospiraceae bacterium]